jgi:serine/threonine protein kinase
MRCSMPLTFTQEYVENTEWKRLFPLLTEGDIKHYTFQLLLALSHVHAHGNISTLGPPVLLISS